MSVHFVCYHSVGHYCTHLWMTVTRCWGAPDNKLLSLTTNIFLRSDTTSRFQKNVHYFVLNWASVDGDMVNGRNVEFNKTHECLFSELVIQNLFCPFLSYRLLRWEWFCFLFSHCCTSFWIIWNLNEDKHQKIYNSTFLLLIQSSILLQLEIWYFFQ